MLSTPQSCHRSSHLLQTFETKPFIVKGRDEDDDDDEITQLQRVEIVMRFRKLMSGIEQEEDL